MPPRASTRSQRPNQGSQRPPTQTQGRAGKSSRTQAPPVDEEEEEEQEDDEDEDEDEEEEPAGRMNVDDDDEDGGDSDLNCSANDLIRIALFLEHKRTPLRREDITKKVLGGNGRAFNRVFEYAQRKLKSTFGMELVELPSRAGLAGQEVTATATNEDELEEARKATGIKKKSAALGSKTYILRSCLSSLIIEQAALTDEQILEEEAADMLSDDDSDEGIDDGDDEDERPPRSYGSIISWSHLEQVGPLGILYVILSLVLVSGRVMQDADLRSQLKRLRLPSIPGRAPVHFTTTSTVRSMSIDQYLGLLQRQGYLDRQLVGDNSTGAGKKSGGNKRMRATQASRNDDDGERQMFEWRWGNRAMCEVGEEKVARFVAEFMVGRGGADDEGDEDERAPTAGGSRRRGGAGNARNTQEEKVTKMFAGVEKAAGGKLVSLK